MYRENFSKPLLNPLSLVFDALYIEMNEFVVACIIPCLFVCLYLLIRTWSTTQNSDGNLLNWGSLRLAPIILLSDSIHVV